MTTVIHAFICSFVIHLVYFAVTMIVGYVKTRNYKPDFESAWEEADTLQNEVDFGKATSPFLYLFTFIGVTIFCGIIIFSYKKWVQ